MRQKISSLRVFIKVFESLINVIFQFYSANDDLSPWPRPKHYPYHEAAINLENVISHHYEQSYFHNYTNSNLSKSLNSSQFSSECNKDYVSGNSTVKTKDKNLNPFSPLLFGAVILLLRNLI